VQKFIFRIGSTTLTLLLVFKKVVHDDTINPTLPAGKDRLGTRGECLRKGFAIGQKQKYDRDGGIQRQPVLFQDRGWYKLFFPFRD
jgi:hypothetical protein